VAAAVCLQIEPGSSLLDSGPLAATDPAELYPGYHPSTQQPDPFTSLYGHSSCPLDPPEFGFLQAPTTMAPSWVQQPYTDMVSLSLQEQLPGLRNPNLLGPHSPYYAMQPRFLHQVERSLPHQQVVPAAPAAGMPQAVARASAATTAAGGGTGSGGPAGSQFASGYQVGMQAQAPSAPEIQQMMQQLALQELQSAGPQPPPED
jgi:hypothetical protein